MKIIRHLSAITAALCLAAPVSAASLTIDGVDGIWSTSQPVVNGIGSTELRWGTPARGQPRQSGYDFVASQTPFEVEDGRSFVLGTFTHLNFPITGVLLEAADLAVSFVIAGVEGEIQTTFSFNHFETYNEATRCADGGANGVGANVNGCADNVLATLNEAKSEVFELDGVIYQLDISGFQYDGRLFQSFWTQEDRANSAELIAVFNVVDTISEVPLPASGLFLLGGLGAFAMQRKRRKQNN
ncbi:MAG: VPLPA-CTERM sorting domain-containing protein [Silicimonas sp.]|nr:VPLPA-CTERM sorting domain-containing protein [Silicimonas sp.]